MPRPNVSIIVYLVSFKCGNARFSSVGCHATLPWVHRVAVAAQSEARTAFPIPPAAHAPGQVRGNQKRSAGYLLSAGQAAACECGESPQLASMVWPQNKRRMELSFRARRFPRQAAAVFLMLHQSNRNPHCRNLGCHDKANVTTAQNDPPGPWGTKPWRFIISCI